MKETQKNPPMWPDTATGAIEALRHLSVYDVPDDAKATPDPSHKWVWKVEFSQRGQDKITRRSYIRHVTAVVYLDVRDFESDHKYEYNPIS